MATKVENGQVVKPDAPTERGVVTGFRDVISDDAGRTDLVDFQYFFFNLVALTLFAVSFVPEIEAGFPDIPEFLVGLTSASGLAYVTKKALERQTPQISRVAPASAFPGDEITIHGRYIAAPSGKPPAVTIDRKEALDVKVVGPTHSDTSIVSARLPPDLASGADKELVVIPEGATVPATAQITVLGVAVTGVEPVPVPARTGATIIISGAGFGAVLGTVELGDKRQEVIDWIEDRITARLVDPPPAEQRGEGKKLLLRVVLPEGDEERPTGSKLVEVESP